MRTCSPTGAKLLLSEGSRFEHFADLEPSLSDVHGTCGVDLVQKTLSFDGDHRMRVANLRNPTNGTEGELT